MLVRGRDERMAFAGKLVRRCNSYKLANKRQMQCLLPVYIGANLDSHK